MIKVNNTWMILFRKNIRDFKANFGELSSILILSFMSLLVFAGLLSASNGMKIEFNKWANKSNLADEWVLINNGKIRTSKLNADTNIKHFQKQFVFNAYTGSENSKKMLQVATISSNTDSKPSVIKGSGFSSTKKGIWIDKNYAHKNNLKVGSSISIKTDIGEKKLKVNGLIVSPNYIGYTDTSNDIVANHKKYGYAITNYKSMSLSKNQVNQILVSGTKGVSSKKLKASLNKDLASAVVSISSRNENNNVAKFTDKANSIEKLSVLFCLVLFSLVILTTATTMSRLIYAQRQNIGLLRALGFSKALNYFHFIQYGLVTTIIGGVTGLILGPRLIGPLILTKQEPLFNMVSWQVHSTNFSWVMLSLLLVVSLCTSLMAVRKSVKNTPAKILQDNMAPSKSQHASIITKNLGWDWKWVLRDKSRDKVKELIGIIAIIGSLMLIIASLGIQNSLVRTNKDTFGSTFAYKNELKIKSNSPSMALNKLTAKLNDDYQMVEQVSMNIQSATNEELSTGTIVGNGIYLSLPSNNGTVKSLNDKNGVYVSALVAKKLNIKTNQNVRLKTTLSVKPIVVPVLGIVNVSSPQGVYLNSVYWQKLKQNFSPTSVYTGQTVDKSTKSLNIVNQTNTLSHNLNNADTVLSSFQSVIALLIVFSLLLSWFVLYNLGMLNFTERYREYATMKILGFRLNEIRSTIIKDSLITWFVGTIIGLPVGLLFLRAYVNIANSQTTQFFAQIGMFRLILAIAIVFVNTFIISLVVARQVKKIDMASALKSVD